MGILTRVEVIDIIENARMRWIDNRLVEVARSALVQLGTKVPVTQDKAVLLAKQADVIPIVGSVHPHDSTLVLHDVNGRALEPRIVMLDLVYRGPEENMPFGETFEIEGGSVAEQIETALDEQGSQITLTHDGEMQGGTIAPYENRETIRLAETISSNAPWLISRQYSNTVNSGGFYFDATAAPRTWRFAFINYTLSSRTHVPPRWRLSYELVKNTNGHDPQVVYVDPETGEPPPGLVQDEGYKTIPWYQEVDFSAIFGN